jgi:hypothetical protein
MEEEYGADYLLSSARVCKDLGKLHHFLGVTVKPCQAGLLLH